jgi:hypothetical protein
MTLGLLIGVVSALAAVWGFRVMWCEWRGTDGVSPKEAPDWWPFDMPTWRAVIRAGPVGALEAAFAALNYFVRHPVTQGLVLATLALMIVIGLYNRPSWAVAPRFRRYPGAIDEWKDD